MEEARKWEELPVDCLAEVFGRLSLKDLVLSVDFVCKSWYKASLEPKCWKILSFHDFPFSLSDEYDEFSAILKHVLNRSRGSARVVSLPSIEHATFEDLVLISHECPNLECLAVPQNKFAYTPFSISGLICKWKKLQILYLRHLPSDWDEVFKQIHRNCKDFVELQTLGWIGEDVAQAIVTYIPKIKFLSLSGSSISKNHLLLILKGCRELEQLHVKNCRGLEVDDELLKATAHIKSFEYEGSRLYMYDSEEDYAPLSMSDVYDGNSDDGYEL